MHTKRGNFCIFLLKITEKRGKTDLLQDLNRLGVRAAGVFSFISCSNVRKKGQFLHFSIENHRKRGKTGPFCRFFPSFLIQMFEKRGNFCIFRSKITEKRGENRTENGVMTIPGTQAIPAFCQPWKEGITSKQAGHLRREKCDRRFFSRLLVTSRPSPFGRALCPDNISRF